jgi:uncharacterized membrane protein
MAVNKPIFLTMSDAIVHFFSTFPHWLATVLMAVTPVGELRLALPVAILKFGMPVWQAFFWAVLGNMIPATIILLCAGPFQRYVQKGSGRFFGKAWARSLARAQEKFAKEYEKYGLVGLMIFIGVPLPMTGAWTGSLAAFVFGIPVKKSWPFVFGGVLIAAVITTIITVGVGKIF